MIVMSEQGIFIVVTAGFILSLAIFMSADLRLSGWLVRIVQFLFIVQISCYLLRIGSLPFAKTRSLGRFLFNAYIIPYAFFTGIFLSYLMLKAGKIKRIRVTDNVLADKKNALTPILKLSAATVFLYSACGSIFSYQRSVQFFTTSGYNEYFFIFIIVIEFSCAIALLSKKTASWAALILIVDMIGAVSTHYHNFFTKDLPHPLNNSIPALTTLTVLISIAYLSRQPRALMAHI